MLGNLREKWRKSKEAKAAKAAVYAAISSDDPAKVKDALEAARQAEAIDKAGFLEAAIDNQHLGVFKEVLAFVDDPNIEMSYRVRRGDSYVTYTCSPMYYAVARARTHDISLALANNPRANVFG